MAFLRVLVVILILLVAFGVMGEARPFPSTDVWAKKIGFLLESLQRGSLTPPSPDPTHS